MFVQWMKIDLEIFIRNLTGQCLCENDFSCGEIESAVNESIHIQFDSFRFQLIKHFLNAIFAWGKVNHSCSWKQTNGFGLNLLWIVFEISRK